MARSAIDIVTTLRDSAEDLLTLLESSPDIEPLIAAEFIEEVLNSTQLLLLDHKQEIKQDA
jgi:hypothetical protein